jgi:hypothetical protein
MEKGSLPMKENMALREEGGANRKKPKLKTNFFLTFLVD